MRRIQAVCAQPQQCGPKVSKPTKLENRRAAQKPWQRAWRAGAKALEGKVCDYFCSTTDPHSFGSGDKTRHNIVGDTGVLIGASGDLHYGLPWQSLGPTPLHSLHVPIRLRLHIAAPDELLATALAGTTVEQLAAHGWLNITSISTQTTLQPVEAR